MLNLSTAKSRTAGNIIINCIVCILVDQTKFQWFTCAHQKARHNERGKKTVKTGAHSSPHSMFLLKNKTRDPVHNCKLSSESKHITNNFPKKSNDTWLTVKNGKCWLQTHGRANGSVFDLNRTASGTCSWVDPAKRAVYNIFPTVQFMFPSGLSFPQMHNRR